MLLLARPTLLGMLSLALLWGAAACSDGSMPSERHRFTQGRGGVQNPSTSVDPRDGDSTPVDGSTNTPKPPKTPKPQDPPTTPPPVDTAGDAAVESGSGNIQSLDPVDVYCSAKTVSYNDGLHFENSQRVTLRFYDGKSSLYTWKGFLNTAALRDTYAASKVLQVPTFTGGNLPDGMYDVLICEKDKLSSCLVNFKNIFEFTPYEAVYYGKASGLIGTIARAKMVNGRFESFAKLSLVHSNTPTVGNCTTEHE